MGLRALEKAFKFRLYAAINPQEIKWVNDKTVILRMVKCRVQAARHQKNLPDFPPVGTVEFTEFAKAIDS